MPVNSNFSQLLFQEPGRTLSQWAEMGEYSYMESDITPASWDEAKAYCAENNASLLDFSVGDDELYVNQANSSHSFWIGLSRNATKLIEIPRNMSDILIVGMDCTATKFFGNNSVSMHPASCVKSYYASICVKRKIEGKPIVSRYDVIH